MATLAKWEGPWNDAKDDAECYCGKCDFDLNDQYGEHWNFCPSCGEEIVYHGYREHEDRLSKEARLSARKKASRAIMDRKNGLKSKMTFRKKKRRWDKSVLLK